jgi:hypothetical protein
MLIAMQFAIKSLFEWEQIIIFSHYGQQRNERTKKKCKTALLFLYSTQNCDVLTISCPDSP